MCVGSFSPDYVAMRELARHERGPASDHRRDGHRSVRRGGKTAGGPGCYLRNGRRRCGGGERRGRIAAAVRGGRRYPFERAAAYPSLRPPRFADALPGSAADCRWQRQSAVELVVAAAAEAAAAAAAAAIGGTVSDTAQAPGSQPAQKSTASGPLATETAPEQPAGSLARFFQGLNETCSTRSGPGSG